LKRDYFAFNLAFPHLFISIGVLYFPSRCFFTPPLDRFYCVLRLRSFWFSIYPRGEPLHNVCIFPLYLTENRTKLNDRRDFAPSPIFAVDQINENRFASAQQLRNNRDKRV
jgi:hypothetical protein